MTRTAATFIALAVTAALLGVMSAAFAAAGHTRGFQAAGARDGSERMLDA